MLERTNDAHLPARWCLQSCLPRIAGLGFFLFLLFLLWRSDGQGLYWSPEGCPVQSPGAPDSTFPRTGSVLPGAAEMPDLPGVPLSSPWPWVKLLVSWSLSFPIYNLGLTSTLLAWQGCGDTLKR